MSRSTWRSHRPSASARSGFSTAPCTPLLARSAKRGSSAKSALADQLTEPDPVILLQDGDEDLAADHVEGTDGRNPQHVLLRRLRRHPRRPVLGNGKELEPERRVVEAHFHVRPHPLPLALQQRRQHRLADGDPGGGVDQGQPLVDRAHELGHAGLGLNDVVDAPSVGPRAGDPEAGERGVDDHGVERPHVGTAQTLAFECTGPEALEHHIGPRDKSPGHLLAVVTVQVERKRPLVAVRRLKEIRHGRPRIVAAVDLLHLDHVGPEVGQEGRARRTGHHRGEVRNQHALQHPAHTHDDVIARSVSTMSDAEDPLGISREECVPLISVEPRTSHRHRRSARRRMKRFACRQASSSRRSFGRLRRGR